jgi:Terpene cyclase DEP1
MKNDKLLSWIYLALAVLGLLVTWSYFFQFFAAGGTILPASFLAAAMVNPVASAMTADIYLSAIAFAIWVYSDSRRSGIGKPWFFIALCFALGLCVAWPFYLGLKAWQTN